MAIENSLTKQDTPQQSLSVKFTVGNEEVWLTPGIVKKYLVSGDPDKVTDQELGMFIKMCQFQHLNPFLKEAHLIKYGNSPATMVTGKDAFEKRARRNPQYKGATAGVIVINRNGEIENRVGSLVLQDEKKVGGWAKVHVEGDQVPTEISVSFDEYVGKKSNGETNQQWTTKPATMIRKVARVQALREAFPEDFGGMYSAEEMGVDVGLLDETPIEQPVQQAEVIEQPPFDVTDDVLG